MTNEEAIEYLKKADVTVYQEPKTKTAEALEMAIESLKHIPCYLDSPCEYQNPDIKIPHTDCIVWHPYPQEKPTREGEYYLVTALRGGEHQVCTAWWIDESYRFGIFTDRVTAWAELPKPYEEGAEE